MQHLTSIQLKIVTFIEEFYTSKGRSPSFREIGSHFGFSSLGTVYNHVQALKKKGALEKSSRLPHSLKISGQQEEKREDIVNLPLAGLFQEGRIEWLTHPPYFSIPSWMLNDEKEGYLIRMETEELKEEFLVTNDLLLLQPTTPVDGQRVLAIVDEKIAIIKKLFGESDFYRFESESPAISPFYLRKLHVKIVGVVRGVIRSFQIGENYSRLN